jgi:DNA topoisomerase-3
MNTMSDGELFETFCCNMLEKQTMPKPLFTEATLLEAMEHAGKNLENEEMREAMAGSGIGTPATRAGIIETLLKRGYMQRDNKNLTPTDKGLQLYHAVKSLQIADVRLTGEWEAKLLRIEKEPTFRDVFMEEIREYTQRVVDEISSVKLPENDRKLICPKCKTATVKIYGKVAKCSDADCNFTIFRSICGKNLTDNQITELIKTGKTGLIKGFKNKQGKSFNASLRLDEAFSVVLEFSNPKN